MQIGVILSAALYEEMLLTVHSREWQGQSAKLLFEGYFDVEFYARHIRHDEVHD
jgi:hypothetical protein